MMTLFIASFWPYRHLLDWMYVKRYFWPYLSRETPPELPPELLNSRLLCVVTSWETRKNNWYFIVFLIFLCVFEFLRFVSADGSSSHHSENRGKRGRRRKQAANFSRCLLSLTAAETSITFQHFSNLRFLLKLWPLLLNCCVLTGTLVYFDGTLVRETLCGYCHSYISNYGELEGKKQVAKTKYELK